MALKSILIIEDDLGIRAGLQEFFEGDGYIVLLAENGRVAIDLLKKSDVALPGLILLDRMMPVMDGPTFLSELKQNHPEIFANIPIFITTAGGDAHRKSINATGFIKKPFDLNELSTVVTKYCGS